MKRYLPWLFLFPISCQKPSAPETAIFNVATYNLRQLNENDKKRGDGWENRGPVLASLIKFHDFSIFGTQEGFKKLIKQGYLLTISQ